MTERLKSSLKKSFRDAFLTRLHYMLDRDAISFFQCTILHFQLSIWFSQSIMLSELTNHLLSMPYQLFKCTCLLKSGRINFPTIVQLHTRIGKLCNQVRGAGILSFNPPQYIKFCLSYQLFLCHFHAFFS